MNSKGINMVRSLIKSFGILFASAVLVTACSSTQLTSVWKEPSYQARPAKVMVIGVAKKPQLRRLFEDEFVNQLKAHGTDAIASYTVLPDDQADKAVIAAKLKELGADSVLVTRLVDKKTVKVDVPGTAYAPPPYYGSWPAYYGYGYNNMYSPGYTTEYENAVIETNLYDAGNEKLVWSALSDTMLGDDNEDLIKSYIEVLVNALSYDKMLGK